MISGVNHRLHERIFSLGLIGIFAVFSVTFMIVNNLLKSTISEIKNENELLITENNNLLKVLEKSRALNEDLIGSRPGLSEKDIVEFRKRGLPDPQDDIINDLLKHEKLLPAKDMLSAEPSLSSGISIYVLNSQWVYASFGVKSGLSETLLKYSVSKDGKISWKVISAFVMNNE